MSSYINSTEGPASAHIDWHAITWERLAWRYSPERASLIMEGRDPATQADLHRWRSLGSRGAAA